MKDLLYYLCMVNASYQNDAYWYSKINTFRTCPALYKAQYVDKTLPMSTSLDMEYGTALHLGISEYLKGEDGHLMFHLFWEQVKKQNIKSGRYTWEMLKSNGEVHLAKFVKQYLSKFKPLKIEDRIHATLHGYKVEGTPDLICEYEGNLTVVDWKSAAKRYEPEAIECEEQLSFYGKLSELGHGIVPTHKMYLVFVKDYHEGSIQRPMLSRLSTENINRTVDNLVLTIEQIEKTKTFARHPQNCMRGSFRCGNYTQCWSSK